MKKFAKILSLILVVTMLFSLAACGDGGKKDGKTVIKFANYARLESGYTEFWNGVKTGFEEKNPDYEIEWIEAPYGEIAKTVINMAGAGDKADLIFGEIGWTPQFEDAGISVPVDTILSKEFMADFPQAILDSHSINGKPYSIPLYVSPFVLYYNKDILAKAGVEVPTTYDEMLVAAEKIAKLKDKDGNKIYPFGQTTASVPVSGSSITAMMMNFGANILDSNGKLKLTDPGFKEAVEMLKTLDDKGYNPQNQKLKDLRQSFATGNLAMYYDQSWGFNGVASINPDAKNFAASAKPLKGGNGNGASLLQSHCFMMSDNGAERTEGVKLLVEYIISEEVLKPYMQNVTPAYPARTSMANMELNPVLAGAAGSQNNVIAQTFVPQLANLNLDLCSLAQAVSVSDKSVDVAIKEFETNATNTLR